MKQDDLVKTIEELQPELFLQSAFHIRKTVLSISRASESKDLPPVDLRPCVCGGNDDERSARDRLGCAIDESPLVHNLEERVQGLGLGLFEFIQKQYASYSGYPGGLKYTKLQDVLAKKGHAEAIRRAVFGMLPGNRLRAHRMKRLIIME